MKKSQYRKVEKWQKDKKQLRPKSKYKTKKLKLPKLRTKANKRCFLLLELGKLLLNKNKFLSKL